MERLSGYISYAENLTAASKERDKSGRWLRSLLEG